MRTQEGQALINWLALKRSGATRVQSRENKEQEQLQAAEALHREHLAAVFAFVVRRVPNRQDAEDVTAEVFAAAFAALPGRKEAHEPYPWLLGIARRKIADLLRRQARQGARAEADAEEAAGSMIGPEAALAWGERADRLRGLLDNLPPDQREALLLHYVEDLSHVQVAAMLGRSPAAVNSLIQRARAAVYRQGQGYFLEESEANQ